MFIVESTMDLYSFIKSMCIRALLTRVFDDQAGPVVYESITIIYEDVRCALKIAAEDEKK